MEPTTNATVYIVDDDASVREALAWLLRSRRLFSESFESAEAFDAMLSSRPAQRQPCCLLLDVRMPGTSGLALFDKLVELGLVEVMPVIFLTAESEGDDRARELGGEFLEKPIRLEELLAAVSRHLPLPRR